MKTALLLTVASLAATVLGAKPATEEVKNDAAAGRYNRPSYGNQGYGNSGYSNPGYGYPSYGPGYWQPLVQDRFVCDLDASVLLVVDSHNHNRHHQHHQSGYGYGGAAAVPANRAVRVKCAEVANHDADSCNFCCQQTARRDTTLANDKLFGFLAITKTDDEETFKREKRGADESPEDDDDDDRDRRHGKHHGRFHKVDPTYVVEADWTAPKYHTNVKCVCCAPRGNAAAQNPSVYNSPPAASNPSTGYQNGNANTFNTQPVPAAQQPFVDAWQSPDNSWSTTSNTAAANTWSDAAAAAPASNWGAASDAAAPAPPPVATSAPVVAASNTY